ncbi:MAG: hypothetical protein ACI4C3_04760 [Bacteroides sp.]
MKLKRFLSYMAFGLTVALPFTACDDDDDNWQAAQPVDKNCIGAYFASYNSASFITTPEEYAADPTFTLTVCREETTGTATVGIEVVENPYNLQVPKSVEFADGANEAYLTINYSGIPSKEQCNLSLKIEDKMVNPYLIQDGMGSYSCSVLVSEWVKVGDQVPFNFSYTGLPTIYQNIYHLDGVNLFRIENFFNTGIDLRFTIVGDTKFDNEKPSTWKGYIDPVANCDLYAADGYWYFVNGEEYPMGKAGDVEMWYLGFWYGTGYSSIMFDYNGKGDNYILFTPFWDDTEDSQNSYWDYVKAYWNTSAGE